MRRSITALILIAILLASAGPARSYTLQFADGTASVRIKWPNNVVTVALSSSLGSPPVNIKAGSDVMGAARRALLQWAGASNIRFVEVSSSAQSVSPSNGGDALTLITVANTAENAALFTGSDRPGRTRVFFDPATGLISEADIALNPAVQFSTDGTFGTYDLEAVLTHEIGHLLGLEHSGMVGATMQPRLALNGLYTLPAFSPRTLSEDDRAGVRSLYGPQSGQGAIAGSVSYAGGAPAYGAHVWAQDVSTGRSIAGTISSASGAYRIEDLPPGQYRLVVEHLNGNVIASEIASSGGAYAGLANPQAAFRATEVSDQITIVAGATVPLNISLSGGQPFLNPRLLGINGQLSTIAVPLAPGRTFTVYVGGEGLDQVAGQGIDTTSPYITVEPQSLVLQQLGTTYPIISFNVKVDRDVPAGEYDLRFRSNSGEVSYIAGGLTIDEEGRAPLSLQAGEVDYDEVAAAMNPADPSPAGTDDPPLLAASAADYLSGESAPSASPYGAGKVERAGSSSSGAFDPLQSAVEERFQALVQPLSNPAR